MRRHLCTLAILAALTCTATAGIPDLGMSDWSCRTDQDVTILICPAGDGIPLDAAWPVGGGDPVDATIDVWVRDGNGTPVAYFPFEDIWLDGPHLYLCPGGSVAEESTDPQGHTYFRTLFAGGTAFGDQTVRINGDAISGHVPNMRLVSPDVHPDLVVNVTDLVIMAQSLYGSYNTAADLDSDGQINLTDVVLLIQHYNHTCP